MEKFKIETLSPLHIGNGNTLTPIDIGEHNEFIYVFDLDKVIEHIPERHMDRISELISNPQGKNLGEILKDELKINPKNWEKLKLYKVRKTDSEGINKIYKEIKY